MTVAGKIMPPGRFEELPTGPIAFPPEAILTVEQLAAWLQVSVGTVEKLPIACFYVRSRKRYLGRHVLDYIEGQAKP